MIIDFSSFNEAIGNAVIKHNDLLSQIMSEYNYAIARLRNVPMDYSSKYVEMRLLNRDPESGEVSDVSTNADISTAETLLANAKRDAIIAKENIDFMSSAFEAEFPSYKAIADIMSQNLSAVIEAFPY